MRVEISRAVSGTMVDEYLAAIEELCKINIVADDNGIKFEVAPDDGRRHDVMYDVTLTIDVQRRRKKSG